MNCISLGTVWDEHFDSLPSYTFWRRVALLPGAAKETWMWYRKFWWFGRALWYTVRDCVYWCNPRLLDGQVY